MSPIARMFHMPESERPKEPSVCDGCGREIQSDENVTAIVEPLGVAIYCTACK